MLVAVLAEILRYCEFARKLPLLWPSLATFAFYLDDHFVEHDRRLIIVEKDIGVLQKDVLQHKLSMDQVVAVLNLIRDEVVATKGFLKAVCVGAVIICTLIGTAYLVNWIQIPSSKQENLSH